VTLDERTDILRNRLQAPQSTSQPWPVSAETLRSEVIRSAWVPGVPTPISVVVCFVTITVARWAWDELTARPKMDCVTLADLTGAERLLWEAFPRGAWVDLGGVDVPAESLRDAIGSDSSRIIRAEVISTLLLGAVKAEAGWAAAIRLRGAVIAGRLDLIGASVAVPLTCERCWFDSEIGFVECSVKTISVINSQLPAFNGTRMRLDGILDLRGSAISGIVRLEQAKVTGHLCLRGARVGKAVESGAVAVSASGLVVDGVDASCLEARGAIVMPSTTITGSVDLTAAHITCSAQQALVMDYSVIGGKLDCEQILIEGEFRIHNGRVTAMIRMSGARLDNPGGVALSGGGLTAGGGVFLTGGFSARGELRLVGARLAANLTMNGATFDNPGGLAVNLERATIGSCDGIGLTCRGQLSGSGPYFVTVTGPFSRSAGRACGAAGSGRGRTSGV
jgi:hypothetical protein